MASKNYINNKEFLKHMKLYHAEYQKYLKKEIDEPPIITNYIGECIYQIATKLSNHRKFSGYTYKEEMIGDAIEASIKGLKSFNPEKSDNPFAYFTQICYNAFLQRIQKEKKQSFIKMRSFDQFGIECALEGHVVNEMNAAPYLDSEKAQALSDLFEKKKVPAKKKKNNVLERVKTQK